jgi:hypothetical protein
VFEILEARSADSAAEMTEYIVWEYRKPTMMLSDNGQEFRSNLFLATLNRYGIKPKRTTLGHP